MMAKLDLEMVQMFGANKRGMIVKKPWLKPKGFKALSRLKPAVMPSWKWLNVEDKDIRRWIYKGMLTKCRRDEPIFRRCVRNVDIDNNTISFDGYSHASPLVGWVKQDIAAASGEKAAAADSGAASSSMNKNRILVFSKGFS